MKSKSTTRSERLGKEEWLSRALEHLAKEGREKLTIDRLVAALGVTKGSFYWHFTSRKDFHDQLLQYWDERFTQSVIGELAQLDGDPAAQLWKLMEVVFENDLTRYDLVVRAWAAQDAEIADYVQRVDQTRTRVVRGLFKEMGFTGVQLEMRTHSSITYLSMETGVLVKKSRKQRRDCLRQFHQLMTTTGGVKSKD